MFHRRNGRGGFETLELKTTTENTEDTEIFKELVLQVLADEFSQKISVSSVFSVVH